MNFEVRVVSEATFENYVKALASIPYDDPQRQAKALRAALEIFPPEAEPQAEPPQ